MDPLAQLRDIHLPEAVSFWPLAIGWWLLLLIGILALVYAGFKLFKLFSRSAYRRVAVKELKKAWQQFESNENKDELIISINQLLKIVAVNTYGKSRVSTLSGQRWIDFLEQTGRGGQFNNGPGKVLITGPYQPLQNVNQQDFEARELFNCALHWVRKHR